jgi:ABC-type transport system involved in cytochrome c biogenesis permease subunit
MMDIITLGRWDHFAWFGGLTLALWSLSIAAALWHWRLEAGRPLALRVSSLSALLGTSLITSFAALLWIALERPPLKTLGETRLWYSIFLPWIGLIVEYRWGMRWLRHYSVAMASLFILLNWLKPDAHDRTLMPALQSYWFVPHVVVYMLSYALLGASFLVALHGLWRQTRGQPVREQSWLADQCVLIGLVFLTFGLLFGGIWAKEAWGHYWTWDPKETWALITWMIYLIYLHAIFHRRPSPRGAFFLLVGAFALLLVCWFGVNYLPSAAESVHTYSQSGN